MADEAAPHSSGVLRELLAVFGFGVDTSGLKEGENALEGFFKKVSTFAQGIAGLFVLHEIKDFVDEQAKASIEAGHMADRLGITVERVKQLRFASESLGLSHDGLLDQMGRLQVAQQAAAKGGKGQSEAFSRLGVSMHDSTGKMKPVDELLLDIADGMGKLKDPSARASSAVALFGRAGRELLPFLSQGRKGAEELFARFTELGGGFDKEAAEGARKYTRAQAELNLVLRIFKGQVAASLFPIMTKLVTLAADAVNWFRRLAQGTEVVKAVLLALASVATVFAIKMALANLPIIAMTAAITGLILIIDDLIVFFEGGQSLIGETIDRIFGKGASTHAIERVRERWHEIKDAIVGALDAIKEFVGSQEGAERQLGKWWRGAKRAVGAHVDEPEAGEEGGPAGPPAPRTGGKAGVAIPKGWAPPGGWGEEGASEAPAAPAPFEASPPAAPAPLKASPPAAPAPAATPASPPATPKAPEAPPASGALPVTSWEAPSRAPAASAEHGAVARFLGANRYGETPIEDRAANIVRDQVLARVPVVGPIIGGTNQTTEGWPEDEKQRREAAYHARMMERATGYPGGVPPVVQPPAPSGPVVIQPPPAKLAASGPTVIHTGDQTVQVTVEAASSQSAPEVGEEVARQVSDVLKQQRRETAATFPRAVGGP